MTRAASLTIARTVGRLSRRLGRGGGTSAPGKVLLRLRPGALEELGRDLPHGAAVVSATNGKTTTARLIAACLDAEGWRYVSNPAGANLASGVATALLEAAARRPRPDAALLEVDEFALPEVARRLRPRVVLLMNLFRDQLDRYGELEAIAEAWARMVAELPGDTHLVLNADDPAVAGLADGGHPVTYFGVEDPAVALDALPHASDSTRCRVCGAALDYARVTLGHMGDWACPRGHTRRPAPDVALTRVVLEGPRGAALELATPQGPMRLRLALPGVHNAYNAAAAVAGALALGVEAARIPGAVAGADAAFGRGERVRVGDRELVLLLAKNPAGANTTVQTVLLDPDPLHLLVALNDRTADGQDVSWIWDVDYEPLVDRLAALTVTGDRAGDMALRFLYAGLPRERIHVVADPAEALDAALDGLPAGAPLYALPTYTAMLGLREILVRRGAARAFWHDR
ncbi:MAG TPA: MurT ligase domain-containing protein [Miltoncostaeaceae bacterium]|nr:MurT ligase domain-containing protein [Miltoncostaeaceae bacterium]